MNEKITIKDSTPKKRIQAKYIDWNSVLKLLRNM